MADIDEGARIQRQLWEDIWKPIAKEKREAEAEKPKPTFSGLFLLLLGAILTAGAEYVIDGKEKS